MRKFKFYISVCSVFLCNILLAQKRHPLLMSSYEPHQSFKHFITKTPWIIQAAGNVVDDDGKPFKKVFDVKNSWNLAVPIKVSIEKELKYNWDVELAFTYNKLNAGKIINNEVLTSPGTFYAIDLNGKKILTRLFRIEPYLFSGFGYTMRTQSGYSNTITLNAGFGFNIWIIDNVLGVNVQGSGKFGLTSPLISTGANYLQHSAGINYKFSGNRKKLKAARLHISKIYKK